MYDGESLYVTDMPTYVAVVSGKNRTRIAEAGVRDAFDIALLYGVDTFVIEQVGGMPSQSAPAAFTFGYGVGLLTAFAIAAGMRIERVAPSSWKAALRVPADKRAARARASEILPAWSHLWPLQKHDGRAEAAMLAHWGWLTRGKLT